jgi:hypothetical protein
MKRILLIAVAILAVNVMQAQSTKRTDVGSSVSVKKAMDAMAKSDMNLTSEQMSKISEILSKRDSYMAIVKDNAKVTDPKVKAKQIEDMNARFAEMIMKELTGSQPEKFKRLNIFEKQ